MEQQQQQQQQQQLLQELTLESSNKRKVSLKITQEGIEFLGDVDDYELTSLVADLSKAFTDKKQQQTKSELISDYLKVPTAFMHFFVYLMISGLIITFIAGVIQIFSNSHNEANHAMHQRI